MTNKELVQAMRTILIRPNIYRNDYPYNCCYYDGHFISADCWNVIKAILWDSDIVDNYEVGKYSYKPNKTIGDWDGETILANCTEKGTDISKAPIGAFLLYEDGSHAGIYLGNMQAIEMTEGWNAHRMVISEIGKNGERSSNGIKWGRWKAWGKLPGVEYIKEPEPVKYDFHKGDIVKVKKDAHPYEMPSTYFVEDFYPMEHMILEEPTSDRIVLTDSKWGLNPVNASDLIKVDKLQVGDAVEVTADTSFQDIFGTWLNVPYLKQQKLSVLQIEGDNVYIKNADHNWLEAVVNSKYIRKKV